jgi:hypothetical protein
MSHTKDCPDRWTARRAGEHAYNRGGSRYSSGYDCDEADWNFRRGYDAAEERRQEEEREDSERAGRRRAAEEQAQSEEYWAMQQAAENDAYQAQCEEQAQAEAEAPAQAESEHR